MESAGAAGLTGTFSGSCVVLQAGQVRISTGAATLEHMAQQFWHRILAMADLDDDQQLSFDEFHSLMKVNQPGRH